MLDKKARTVAEVIEYLQGWQNQNQKVAFTVYTRDDIEADADDYEIESVAEAWDKIVDEVQETLDEGWIVEQISESIAQTLGRHFDYPTLYSERGW